MPGRIAILIFIGALMVMTGCKSKLHVLCIGDSWAAWWQRALEDEVKSRGKDIKVYNMAIPGATAEWWATESALGDVKKLLKDNADIKYCLISLGANDLLGGYLIRNYRDETFTRLDRDIRTVIDKLLEVKPDLHINIHGYDYLNFVQTPHCVGVGHNVFGDTTRFQNSLIERLTQNAFAIAKDYPQVTATNLIGSMQEAAGIAGAPDPAKPSPESMMEPEDCIHPNYNGYRAMHKRIYDTFFAVLGK